MYQSAPNLADILSRVGAGDSEAFAHLYQRTHRKLFGITLRILRREELAEEILQEVYVTIWSRASDFAPGIGSPITWMATIARNRALDELRRRQPQFVDNAIGVEDVADLRKSPADQVEVAEGLGRLWACLDTLDEQHREMVKLAYLDGFSRQELAAHFDRPVGTIKSVLYRSLKQLKNCLGGDT